MRSGEPTALFIRFVISNRGRIEAWKADTERLMELIVNNEWRERLERKWKKPDGVHLRQ